METVPAKLTEKLVHEMDSIVKEGWYASRSELIRDAIRNMVQKIKSQEIEAAFKEDVEWGLHGDW